MVKQIVINDPVLCEFVNALADERECFMEKALLLEPIQKVCDKYNIKLEDLPEVLEEYIAYDNDDNW